MLLPANSESRFFPRFRGSGGRRRLRPQRLRLLSRRGSTGVGFELLRLQRIRSQHPADGHHPAFFIAVGRRDAPVPSDAVRLLQRRAKSRFRSRLQRLRRQIRIRIWRNQFLPRRTHHFQSRLRLHRQSRKETIHLGTRKRSPQTGRQTGRDFVVEMLGDQIRLLPERSGRRPRPEFPRMQRQRRPDSVRVLAFRVLSGRSESRSGSRLLRMPG